MTLGDKILTPFAAVALVVIASICFVCDHFWKLFLIAVIGAMLFFAYKAVTRPIRPPEVVARVDGCTVWKIDQGGAGGLDYFIVKGQNCSIRGRP